MFKVNYSGREYDQLCEQLRRYEAKFATLKSMVDSNQEAFLSTSKVKEILDSKIRVPSYRL